MSKRKFSEFITDPSSGQLSASRFLLMVLVLLYLPVLLTLEALGIHFTMWVQFAVIVSSVAGIYWFNSTARAWNNPGGLEKKLPRPDPPGGNGQ